MLATFVPLALLLPSSLAIFLPFIPETPPLPNVPAAISTAAAAASSLAAVAAQERERLPHQNLLGISAGEPNASLPDPCGPPLQTPLSSSSKFAKRNISTCHANITTSKPMGPPGAYSANCTKRNPSSPEITTCKNAMISVCFTMVGFYGTPPRDQWVWNNQGGNCTLGFWLPAGGAPPPSYARCMDQIYALMVDTCLAQEGGEVDTGSVNLAQLPDLRVFGGKKGNPYSTGVQVNAGYPSYIMAAQMSKVQ